MDKLLQSAKHLETQIISDRRYLHQVPEVGMYLPKSADYIEKRLSEMGISYRRCGYFPKDLQKKFSDMGYPDMPESSGIVATIGSGSPCFLLRADFDALPMEEINDLPFRATSGKAAHMCGHDAHAAMLLGAAKLLKEQESKLRGTVKLMFQPGEELGCGSKTMIDDGLLENPKVDAALGIHVMPTLETGKVNFTYGITSASLDTFIVKIRGKGGHTSTPHLSIDPLMIANQIYTAANLLMTREISPRSVATLSAGALNGGTVPNILPETAQLDMGMRTYDNDARTHILKRMPQLVDHYVKAWRGEYELITFHCPCTVTNEALCNEIRPYAETVVGRENVSEAPPMTGTEDFSYVSLQVPSVFLILGAGKKDAFPLHNPHMTLDESVFPNGAALYAACAINWLASHA